ncbi:Hypothetical predicted protein [Mytilus galloprovincialis]|uniref:Uncharacterized protein n=1 Tax=Mytilus galloprovincialis TaxID=29158 RepID=A0A8B6GU30_MYTGA|nr:Hypothetical predicted protein [Mytilus galloprovincialis]
MAEFGTFQQVFSKFSVTIQQYSEIIYQSIQFEIVSIKANENKCLEKIGVEVIGNDDAKDLEVIDSGEIDNDGYFLYCGKMKTEYSDVTSSLTLKDNTEIVSDIYECRLWCNKRKTLRLSIRLQTVLASNENLIIMSSNGKIGRIDSIDKFTEHKNQSKHVSYPKSCIALKLYIIITFRKEGS